MSSHSSVVSQMSPSPSFFSKLTMRRKKMRAQAAPLHTHLSLTQLPPELLFYLARSYLGKRDILRLCTTVPFSSLLICLYSNISQTLVVYALLAADPDPIQRDRGKDSRTMQTPARFSSRPASCSPPHPEAHPQAEPFLHSIAASPPGGSIPNKSSGAVGTKPGFPPYIHLGWA
jgi:hypothetical protein